MDEPKYDFQDEHHRENKVLTNENIVCNGFKARNRKIGHRERWTAMTAPTDMEHNDGKREVEIVTGKSNTNQCT